MTEPTKEKLSFVNEPINLANKLLADLGINKDNYNDRRFILQGKDILEKTSWEALNYLANYLNLTLIMCVAVAPDDLLVREWGDSIELRKAFSISAQMEIDRSSKIVEQHKNNELEFTSRKTVEVHKKHMEILEEFQKNLFVEASPAASAFKK